MKINNEDATKIKNIHTRIVNELNDMVHLAEKVKVDNPYLELSNFYEDNPNVEALKCEATKKIMNSLVVMKKLLAAREDILSDVRYIDRLFKSS